MRDRDGQVTPIDVLPDEVLLAIFEVHVTRYGNSRLKTLTEVWQVLVHVCRRWRCLVFASPRRLDLHLVCTHGTRPRETLDIWPALPLIVTDFIIPSASVDSVDNIVVALRHRDRIRQIDLDLFPGSQWDSILAEMHVPFPALRRLALQSPNTSEMPPIPDTFLGGSAPLLHHLTLLDIPFPGIFNLLRSATHLANLELHQIPHSWSISPETMATCLSVLTNLASLSISIYSPLRQPPPPTTRYILPNLNRLSFEGTSEYLDDLVSVLDAPRLDYLSLSFNPPTKFDSPGLIQFVSRTPKYKEPTEALIKLDSYTVVRLCRASDEYGTIRVQFLCYDLPSLVSYIARAFTMCIPRPPMVEHLRLGVETFKQFLKLDWKDKVKNDEWLDLLRPFPSVKSFYICEELQPDLGSALQALVGDRTMEVLPFLENIFLESFELSRPFQETIGQFLAARQLSGYSIAVLPIDKCLPQYIY